MADIIQFPNAVMHPEFEAIESSQAMPAPDEMTMIKVSELAKILIPVVNRMTAYCLALNAFIANDTARLTAICEQAEIDFSYVLSVAENAAKKTADENNGMHNVPIAVIESLIHLAMTENAERAQAHPQHEVSELNNDSET